MENNTGSSGYFVSFIDILGFKKIIEDNKKYSDLKKVQEYLNIILKEGKVAKTVELAPEISLDLDKNDKPLYLEIIGASERIGKKRVNEITMRNLVLAQ